MQNKSPCGAFLKKDFPGASIRLQQHIAECEDCQAIIKSQKCIECGADTENMDDGDYICEDCLEASRIQRREDERLDSPLHVPYSNLGRW